MRRSCSTLLQPQPVAEGERRNAGERRRQRTGGCHLRHAVAAARAQCGRGASSGTVELDRARALREQALESRVRPRARQGRIRRRRFRARMLVGAPRRPAGHARRLRAGTVSCATRRRRSRPDSQAHDGREGAASIARRKLAWLKSYVDGRSPWTVGDRHPEGRRRNARADAAQLRSNLVGTTLDLPAPLRKALTNALADDRRNADCRWATATSAWPWQRHRVACAHARRDRARPACAWRWAAIAWTKRRRRSGLIATGRAADARRDRLDRARDARRRASGEGKLPLQRIDVTARRLNAARRRVPRCAPGAWCRPRGRDGGAAPKARRSPGAVLVPDAKGAAIAGRIRARALARAEEAATATACRRRAASAPPERRHVRSREDPAAHLRHRRPARGRRAPRQGEAAHAADRDRHAHRAACRCAPTSSASTSAATGPARGAAARTQLDVRIDSDDFGSAAGRLRFRRQQLGGGKGTVKFDAGWAGQSGGVRRSPRSTAAWRLDMHATAACWKSNPARAACSAC